MTVLSFKLLMIIKANHFFAFHRSFKLSSKLHRGHPSNGSTFRDTNLPDDTPACFVSQLLSLLGMSYGYESRRKNKATCRDRVCCIKWMLRTVINAMCKLNKTTDYYLINYILCKISYLKTKLYLYLSTIKIILKNLLFLQVPKALDPRFHVTITN